MSKQSKGFMLLAVGTALAAWGMASTRAAEAPNPLTISEIVLLSEHFGGASESDRMARERLEQQVQERFLSDVSTTRQVSLEDWMRLTAAFRRDQTGERRAVWIAALHAAFAPDQAGAADVRPGDVLRLMAVLDALGDQQADGIAREMFGHMAAGPVGALDCNTVAKFWLGRRNVTEARPWAQRAYDVTIKYAQVRDQASGRADVIMVAELFEKAGLSGRGRGYPEFAAALVALADKGAFQPTNYFHCLSSASQTGRMLLTPESRQALYLPLSMEKGYLHVGLVEILAWAHRYSGTINEWRKYLDDKIDAANTPADAKAYWLLGRGYAEMAYQGVGDPFAGKKWMDQALATAKAPEARLYTVRRIALGYAFRVQRAKGESILASMEGQFKENRDGFEGLRTDFRNLCTQNEKWLVEQVGKRAVARNRNYVETLHYRLAAVKQSGDVRGIENCERLLGQLAP